MSDDLMILPEGANVEAAFKWMYCPVQRTILVCAGKAEYHADALTKFTKANPSLEASFSRWIRFIHLAAVDFKRGAKKPLLCVRAYDAADVPGVGERELEALIRQLGIKSKIVFGVTNPILAETTGDYLRKW
jgi:hypothetical protein